MSATPHIKLIISSSKIFPDNLPLNLLPPASRARTCSIRTYKVFKNIAKAVSQKRLGGPFSKLLHFQERSSAIPVDRDIPNNQEKSVDKSMSLWYNINIREAEFNPLSLRKSYGAKQLRKARLFGRAFFFYIILKTTYLTCAKWKIKTKERTTFFRTARIWR